MKNRVIILAVDGLDPKIIEKGFKKNFLPNLKKLQESGGYSRLATVEPPQSPVAWESLITGKNPSEHGIFDFIVRDPRSYQLDLVWRPGFRNSYKAEPFWKGFSEKKIPLEILFLPNTFPAVKVYGKMISGMGTPDVLGTAGRHSFYTTGEIKKDSRGNQIKIPNKKVIETKIFGPEQSLVPLKIERGNKKVTITVANQKIVLKKGSFSEWVRLQFKSNRGSIKAIAKFYLKKADSRLEFYLSPLNIDPESPGECISYPNNFSKKLVQKYGSFYTQGLPHDTWALEENVMTEEAFLQNAGSIFEERRKIFFGELDEFPTGVFVNYVGITDTIQHMYWRFLDKKESRHSNVIMDYYKKIDSLVGKTLLKLKKDDYLIVLSDHGFAGFDHEFNLNGWLRDNGFLKLKSGRIGRPMLDNIDWSKTKAYGIGYNGIYLNIKNREKEGVVKLKDVFNIKKDIKTRLENLINPYTKTRVVKKIYYKEELAISEKDTNAPDLFVGYHTGIRASWDSAVGATAKEVFSKRQSKWRGDHLFDATDVPGVFFISKRVALNNVKITDIIFIVRDLIKPS